MYDNWIGRITASPEGNIWCAYVDPLWCEGFESDCPYAGVSRFNGETWIRYDVNDGLPDNRVYWIAADRNDVVYVSTRKGICKFNGKTWTVLTNNITYTMTLGPDGVLWIYGQQGLESFDGSSWKTHGGEPYFYFEVRMLAVDRHGSIWMCLPNAIWKYEIPSAVDSEFTVRPPLIEILGVFPNPFNCVTTLQFTLPREGIVTVSVFNLLGQHVRTLVSEELNAGMHSVLWDGKDESGNDAASGCYLCHLQMKNQKKSKLITLIR